MRRVRYPAALAAAVVALAAGSGCGDSERNNRYVEAVNKAQNEFAATFERLQREITSTSSEKKDRATLNRFQAAIDVVVADLKAVDTPEKVATLHRRLVAQIASYGDEIDKAEKAFASREPARILDAQTRLVAAVTQVSTKINATIDAINTKLRE